MIKVEHVSKKLNHLQVLDDVSLTIPQGSIYGIIGPNGAGKTTLIRHMIGAYRPQHGQVLIEGENIFENEHKKEKMVYIPDEFPMTFGSNVHDIAKVYARLYDSWSYERYHHLLNLLGQNEFVRFNRFSKGMKKQVAFILALSIQPDYLIMDEPFDGLDPRVRKVIWEILIDDVTERQMTIFISSHHLKELDTMCDHVALMNEGKVVFEYALEDLKERFHKIQVAFKKEEDVALIKEQITLLNETRQGKIYQFIVEGDPQKIDETFCQVQPLVLETLPLSLEEIFLFILGGEHDDIKQLFGE